MMSGSQNIPLAWVLSRFWLLILAIAAIPEMEEDLWRAPSQELPNRCLPPQLANNNNNHPSDLRVTALVMFGEAQGNETNTQSWNSGAFLYHHEKGCETHLLDLLFIRLRCAWAGAQFNLSTSYRDNCQGSSLMAMHRRLEHPSTMEQGSRALSEITSWDIIHDKLGLCLGNSIK